MLTLKASLFEEETSVMISSSGRYSASLYSTSVLRWSVDEWSPPLLVPRCKFNRSDADEAVRPPTSSLPALPTRVNRSIDEADRWLKNETHLGEIYRSIFAHLVAE